MRKARTSPPGCIAQADRYNVSRLNSRTETPASGVFMNAINANWTLSKRMLSLTEGERDKDEVWKEKEPQIIMIWMML